MLNNNGISPQSLELTVNGIAMGAFNSDTVWGCSFPPCATVSKDKNDGAYTPLNLAPVNITNPPGVSFGYGYNLPGPYSSGSNDTLWIHWKTNCANLKFDSAINGLVPTKYSFAISVKDDYFRIPSKSIRIVTINLNPPSQLLQTNLTCLNYNSSASYVELNWVTSPGNPQTFIAYQIFRNQTLIKTITNIGVVFYIDSSVNASVDSQYAIQLVTKCNVLSTMQFQNVIKKMQVSASISKKDIAIISWSPINTNRTLASAGYQVYRSFTNNPFNWTLVNDADGDVMNISATDQINLCT